MDQGIYRAVQWQHGQADSAYNMMIILKDSRSVVNVIDLKNMPYIAADNRMQLYGITTESFYVFETDYNPRVVVELAEAIAWYAEYILKRPEMELQLTDPRPVVN